MLWRTTMGMTSNVRTFYGLAPGSYSLAPSANVGSLTSTNQTTPATAYTNARNGTGTLTQTTSRAGHSYTLVKGGTAIASFWQTFLEFDTYTSGIVTTATLSMWFTSKSTSGGTNTDISCGTFDYSTSVTTADFIPGASLPTIVASVPWASLAAINTLSPLTNTGGGLSSVVNTSGFTRLILFSGQQPVSTAATAPARGFVDLTYANCRLDLTII